MEHEHPIHGVFRKSSHSKTQHNEKNISLSRIRAQPRPLANVTNGLENSEVLSDHESSNKKYLPFRLTSQRIKKLSKKIDMNKIFKGKRNNRASSSANPVPEDDVSIYTSQPKSNSRTPKWPEQHNTVLAKLLLEQFLYGNMNNGVLKKDLWCDVVSALNHCLGTSYTEVGAMIRFKNMKSDFRAVYQLSNRSGCGWDEDQHIPIASEEIWDEIIKANPKLGRYRRNPFHQYDIFKKICADNIATGSMAKCSKGQSFLPQHEEDDVAHIANDFMSAHGLSFTGAGDVSVDKEAFKQLLLTQKENLARLQNSLDRHSPYTMAKCLAKLGSMENLTTEGMCAVIDAIKESNDSKVTLMTLEGARLRGWIEHVTGSHPRYYASIAWL